ncbi:MAG: excinuclease ABC subunit UvrA [bacterium]
MTKSSRAQFTTLRGVRTHNLKNVSCDIPIGKLTIVTGVSGSGKSSLAFDTLYAEGQRRYTESLSTYARQFLQRMQKPPFDSLQDVQPAVALRQKNEVTNARSTVSTVTELDDHFGLLFTHAGRTSCPNCGHNVRRDTVGSVCADLLKWEEATRIIVVAEVVVQDPEHAPAILRQLISDGFRRFYVDGEAVDVAEEDVERMLDRTTFPLVIDRLSISPSNRQRIAEALETGFGVGEGRVLIYKHDTQEQFVFDRAFRCNNCGQDLVEPQPALFSFNSSLGACPACNGYGRSIGLDFRKIIPNTGKSLMDGAIEPFASPKYSSHQRALLSACKRHGVAIDVPFKRLAESEQDFVRDGGQGWAGVRGFFEELKDEQYKVHVRVFLAKYRGFDDCVACRGSRLSQDARNTRVADKTIADVWKMRVEQARAFFRTIELSADESARVTTLLDEIQYRLDYLDEVGLGYLELGRPSRTLSGGEMQRIHLTTNLGRALTDTLYVLDEPTAGLHARDSQRLLSILCGLRDLGNTVVVVEHDPEIIEGGDHIVELGPGGGEKGGELVFEGTADVFRTADTRTRRALDRRIARPRGPSTVVGTRGAIEVIGASEHNLENVTVSLPLGKLVAITGVSGSGKSTLMHEVLYNNFLKRTQGGAIEAGAVEKIDGFERVREMILMDQSAIGRSTRSNPLSYSGAYDDVRKLLADTPDAKKRGLMAGDFSFNTPGGRCETCQGLGTVTIEMHFMADIETVCEECQGRRFKAPVLETRFNGKNMTEIFELTIAEAVEFFGQQRPIRRKLSPLLDVGLGYLRLGQSTSTLSGGEAQRVKLASFIGQGKTKDAPTGSLVFIFDEPTIGLHLDDITVLLTALRQIVDQGDSVFVIEHNIDFIAECDHIIDLGPNAGPHGGRIVAQGAPSEVMEAPESVTGRYLKEFFERKSVA